MKKALKTYGEYWDHAHCSDALSPLLFGLFGLLVAFVTFLALWVEVIWADLTIEEFFKALLTALPLVAPHAVFVWLWLGDRESD